MEIYDTVSADTLGTTETLENILLNGEAIELTEKPIDSGDAILIKGFSYDTGDYVTYILDPHAMVDLWQP